MRVLIVGCGFVGLPLGAELMRQGHEVFGLHRRASAKEGLQAAGLQPLLADITEPGDLKKIPREFDWIVNCAAPGGGTAEDYQRLYLSGTRNLLEWLQAAPPRKYVYTSSTSVYGQNDGSTVDENSPVIPATETGKILVVTENLLFAAAAQKSFPAVILRVAGIYGAGRGHWLKQFLAGEAKMAAPGARFTNMIHRDDVIGCINAALERGIAGSVLNATDNEPVTQLKLFEWLSEKFGTPPPSLNAPENSTATRRRGATNKRVSNRRLRQELRYEFKYPTFREGYGAEIAKLVRVEK